MGTNSWTQCTVATRTLNSVLCSAPVFNMPDTNKVVKLTAKFFIYCTVYNKEMSLLSLLYCESIYMYVYVS